MSNIQITTAGVLALKDDVLAADGIRVGRPTADTILVELLDQHGMALAAIPAMEVPVGKRINLQGLKIELGVKLPDEQYALHAFSQDELNDLIAWSLDHAQPETSVWLQAQVAGAVAVPPHLAQDLKQLVDDWSEACGARGDEVHIEIYRGRK